MLENKNIQRVINKFYSLLMKNYRKHLNCCYCVVLSYLQISLKLKKTFSNYISHEVESQAVVEIKVRVGNIFVCLQVLLLYISHQI